MTRSEATQRILAAKSDKGLTFQQLAESVGRHPLWVAAALHGQATMSASEADKVTGMLGLGADVARLLQEIPTRGSFGQEIPVDPTLYRFFEILQVYGPSVKALIHEMFGDGIMSAIDFEMDLQKVADPKGDRVVITLNGKFLPYKKW